MTLLTDLINANLVNETEADELKALLEKEKAETDLILNVLIKFFMSKLVKTSTGEGSYTLTDPDDGKAYLTDEKPTNDLFLDILFNNELITEQVYRKLSVQKIPPSKLGCTATIHIAKEAGAFYQNFTIQDQLEFAEQLGRNRLSLMSGLLEDGSKKRLLRDIQQGKLDTYLDFFRYSYCCSIFDQVPFIGHPEKLLKKLTPIINRLCYGAFFIKSIKMEETEFAGYPSYDNRQMTLLVDTGAKIHRHAFTFSQTETWAPNKSNLVLGKLIEFIDQLLADFNSSYRLRYLTLHINTEIFSNGKKEVAICRVEAQNENIFEFYSIQRKFLFNGPMLHFRLPLSYTHIEYAIHHFKACGMFAHLSDQQLNDTLSTVPQKTYQNVGDLLLIFPDTVAVAQRHFITGQKPYQDFLEALGRISKGKLSFSNISDESIGELDYHSTKHFDITFTIDEKEHIVNCSSVAGQFDDWSFIGHLKNNIIKEYYTEYDLVQFIGSDSETDLYVFMTREQKKYLQKVKLLNIVERF